MTSGGVEAVFRYWARPGQISQNIVWSNKLEGDKHVGDIFHF